MAIDTLINTNAATVKHGLACSCDEGLTRAKMSFLFPLCSACLLRLLHPSPSHVRIIGHKDTLTQPRQSDGIRGTIEEASDYEKMSQAVLGINMKYRKTQTDEMESARECTEEVLNKSSQRRRLIKTRFLDRRKDSER